jgi:hypothetical protein
MWLYTAFLAATLGADDFDTRDKWTDFFQATPVLKPLLLPGTFSDDPEVAYRCKKITGYTPPYYVVDPAARKAYLALYGDPKLAAEDAKWWGCPMNHHRNLLIERVARDTGIIPRAQVIMYGVADMEKWLRICRHRVRGEVCREDPNYVPPIAPPPREKQ